MLGIYATSAQEFSLLKFKFKTSGCFWWYVKVFSALYSSIDVAAKEKLAPFSALSNDESYQSRDLEKVLYLMTDILLLVIWFSHFIN